MQRIIYNDGITEYPEAIALRMHSAYPDETEGPCRVVYNVFQSEAYYKAKRPPLFVGEFQGGYNDSDETLDQLMLADIETKKGEGIV